MKQHHGWDVDFLESLVPFERRVYVDLLLRYLRELEEKRSRG